MMTAFSGVTYSCPTHGEVEPIWKMDARLYYEAFCPLCGEEVERREE